MSVTRSESYFTVKIAANSTTSGPIPTGEFTFMQMYCPQLVGTALTAEARYSPTDDWETIYDTDGATDLAIPVAEGKKYRFPDVAFPAYEMRLVSNATETSEVTFKFYAKS